MDDDREIRFKPLPDAAPVLRWLAMASAVAVGVFLGGAALMLTIARVLQR
jgi:hypothetical protein